MACEEHNASTAEEKPEPPRVQEIHWGEGLVFTFPSRADAIAAGFQVPE